MKRCGKCGKEKPLTEFNRNKRSRDGRMNNCRACVSAYAREYYGRNLDENRAKKRAYMTTVDPEKARADTRRRTQKYQETNPELARAKNQRSREKLRETNPDYHREWHQKHLEQRRDDARKHMRALREARPDLERERKRRYRKNNREAVRRRDRENRYARRIKQPYSRELANHMAELLQWPCVYCGATENITIDHVVPLTRGGKHEARNLAPACHRCNCSKHNHLLSEWPGRYSTK